MNFKNFYSAHKEKINQELGKFLNIKTRQAKKISKDCEKLTEAVKEFTLRGRSKRIRALLVILGYAGFGGRNGREIIKAASFIELIHSYLLIHDDIIDQDDLRRGKPTMHKYFEHSVKSKLSKDKSKLFGVSMGILAGDLCCSLGYEILMKAKFSDKAKARAIEELDNLIFNVIQGEALDVFAQLSKQTSNKEIYNIYKYKTARYSFEQPLRIGGILAGAGESNLNKLSKFAIPLGIAFQIQDDLLGLFGEEKTIGKPAGSDLREGKKTMVLSLALERCNSKERKIIQSVLGGKDIDLKDINRVRDIARKTGALRLCGELIRDYISKSKKALNKIDNFDATARSLLIELADYISNREY
jgi:geranylgeranyl diphosphate synthase type I